MSESASVMGWSPVFFGYHLVVHVEKEEQLVARVVTWVTVMNLSWRGGSQEREEAAEQATRACLLGTHEVGLVPREQQDQGYF